MNVTVFIALVGWIPLVLALFAAVGPRRAVLISLIGGWMFLPMAGYSLPGLPDYNKIVAISISALLGVLVFDLRRLLWFRPSWMDAPMLIWCLCPLATSVSNGLGAYDGISNVFAQVMAWGVPYLLGRLYFSDAEGLRELALAIFVAGLVYIPFCLFEVRMSPKLHKMVYGFSQHAFVQTKRWGGYRPMVFMQHGLMVGMWMAGASLLGFWLWTTKSLKSIWSIPVSVLVPALVVTTVLCKSLNALLLLLIGIFALTWMWRRPSRTALLCLALVPPAYIGVRISGTWSAQGLVSIAQMVGEDRAFSVRTRLENEQRLAERAWERPVFGWGGWNRSRVVNEQGRDTTITDGLWIIAFGQRGIIGMAALFLALLLPVVSLARRDPRWLWLTGLNDALPLAVVLALHAMDNLMNAMTNPAFVLIMGGLAVLQASPALKMVGRIGVAERSLSQPIVSAVE